MSTLTIQTKNDDRIEYRFRSSGPISESESRLNNHDDVSGNEVRGAVSTGTDTIAFRGVPISFTADSPWELDIELGMGGGPVEFVPTFLNSATITVRSDGAHYLLGAAEPAMILKDDKVDPRDGVVNEPNTLVAGNVRDGGEDSWRVWPPLNVSGVADNPAEFKIEGGEWQDMAVLELTMEF